MGPDDSKALKRNRIEEIFASLREGRHHEFLAHVADDVRWEVLGTHPVAGTYTNKDDFLAATFARLNPLMRDRVRLEVTNLLIDGDDAVIELRSTSTQKNGEPYDNHYCWICRFDDGRIVAVRSYLDSALVQQAIDANE